jgi:hypothetical protein
VRIDFAQKNSTHSLENSARGLFMEVKYELSVANILALMRIRLQRSRGLRNPVIFLRLAYLMGFSLMALGTWLVANQVILLVVFFTLAVYYFFPNDSTIIVVKEQIANDEFISFSEVYGENINAAQHLLHRTLRLGHRAGGASRWAG